jgi:hypothetical protein
MRKFILTALMMLVPLNAYASSGLNLFEDFDTRIIHEDQFIGSSNNDIDPRYKDFWPARSAGTTPYNGIEQDQDTQWNNPNSSECYKKPDGDTQSHYYLSGNRLTLTSRALSVEERASCYGKEAQASMIATHNFGRDGKPDGNGIEQRYGIWEAKIQLACHAADGTWQSFFLYTTPSDFDKRTGAMEVNIVEHIVNSTRNDATMAHNQLGLNYLLAYDADNLKGTPQDRIWPNSTPWQHTENLCNAAHWYRVAIAPYDAQTDIIQYAFNDDIIKEVIKPRSNHSPLHVVLKNGKGIKPDWTGVFDSSRDPSIRDFMRIEALIIKSFDFVR